MRFSLVLATTTALFLSMSTANAQAAPIKKAKSPVKISGEIRVTGSSHSNIAKAPAASGNVDTGSDDEDNLGDVADDDSFDDILDDVIDDLELDTEDLDDDAGAPPAPRADGDSRIQTQAMLKHSYKSSDFMSWKSSALFALNNPHDRTELDRSNWALSTGPVFTLSKSWMVSPNISFVSVDVNQLHQLESTIASLSAAWKATKDLTLSVRYGHEWRNNVKANATDIDVDLINLAAKYKLGKKNEFKLALVPKIETNENGDKDKTKLGVKAGYVRQLPWKMNTGLAFSYGDTDFDNVTRDDTEYQYTFHLGKKFTHGLYTNIGTTYKSKDSSVANKGSHDKSVFLQAGWKF
jgi:hypothetical protein